MSKHPPLSQRQDHALTDAAHARSEVILVGLQSRLGRSVRRARAARRIAACAAGITVVCITAWMALPRPSAKPEGSSNHHATIAPPHPLPPELAPTPRMAVVRSDPAPSPPGRVVIRVISDTRGPLEPCGSDAAKSRGDSMCSLSDQQLLTALNELGGSYGIVRVNGRAVVVKDGKVLTDDGG